MDTERNLLFGVVALQDGAVDPDGLAETCAALASESSRTLADLMVDRGLITVDQKTRLEETVQQEMAAHGGDPQATLAATIDGRSLEALSSAGSIGLGITLATSPGPGPSASEAGPGQGGGHVVLGRLSPGEHEPRDRYTLTHLHARGGMGRVWLARDAALGRRIALKELRPDQSDNTVVCSRFLYEAKITAQLEHPGIVPVYELGDGEAPYYTMRFVRGLTLSEAIRAYHKKRAAGEADSVGLHDLLTAFVNVCHAVAYAHSRGIIHRDLKGQNVVLGDFGEVIVLDWGLAKRVGADPSDDPGEAGEAPPDPEAATAATCAADPSDWGLTDAGVADDANGPGLPPAAGSGPSHGTNGDGHHPGGSSGRPAPESGAGPDGTMQGQLLGTPAYMAPEQAEGRHDLVDRRTDIYGLGAILYELLTGRPPFVAPRTSEIIKKVCHDEPTPPRQVVPGIGPGLEAVCLKALRKARDDRYQSASELAQEVRRYLADEPVEAFPEPWTLRALRWARRHRTGVAAAAALLATATITLAVSTVLVAREKREAESQGRQARQAFRLATRTSDVAFGDPLDAVQKERLEGALAYYQDYTGRTADDPSVTLERGQYLREMGDIQWKLGRLGEAEAAYRRAIAALEPLAGRRREARRALARTRTLLADLILRRGGDKGQADALYARALEDQRAMADAGASPSPGVEDLLGLGLTLKSRAKLLRLEGQLREADAASDAAITELERALAAVPGHAEAREALALAVDERGWIRRERGDLAAAEADFRRAAGMLEKLVAEFPTTPRHREALARAINSVALAERDAGRLAEAEADLRRELPLAERLRDDFPDRPEYRRVLGRALDNLGVLLADQHRGRDAEPVLLRAVDVNARIVAESPGDVLFRLDLARDRVVLGEVLRSLGKAGPALEALRAAREINEALVREHPSQPRYRQLLAQNLVNLALAMQDADPSQADELYQSAGGHFDKLVADFPDHVDYRVDQAACLRNQAAAQAVAGRPERAEALYAKALALLETKDAKVEAPEAVRERARLLANLGDLHRPGAEDALRRSIALSQGLLARGAGTAKDRYALAVAQNNLGDHLFKAGRAAEAAPPMAEAARLLEALAAETPNSVDYQYGCAAVFSGQAEVLARLGQPAEARAALVAAVEHQREAVRHARGAPAQRQALTGLLVELADADRKLGLYDEAARTAQEAPQAAAPDDRPRACYDAARALARLVVQAEGDTKVPQVERDRITGRALTRAAILLREAIDAGPKLAERVAADPDLKALRSRPRFEAILNVLVDVAPTRRP